MKNKIKNFLFKKRIKILRNKKGFSLMEVLVAVAIIGIISAIAVPTYTANRKEAAKTAGTLSMNNIFKAYNHCIALKAFDECDSLGKIGVECADCKTDINTTDKKFCAHIEKTSGGKTFNACISIDASASPSKIVRTYGGDLMDKVDICWKFTYSSGSWGTSSADSPIRNCKQDSDCGQVQGDHSTPADNDTAYECKLAANMTGKCASNVCN